MFKIIDFILLISFIGVSVYSIWLLVLVLGSIRDKKINYDKDSMSLLNMKLFIVMPMLNEAQVVKKTLSNFKRTTINMPQVYLYVIDDGSDDGTDKLVNEFIERNNISEKIHLIKRTLPNAQTGKGDALNYGLNYIRNHNDIDNNSIIGVLDADAVMETEDFNKVLYYFNTIDDLALLQTKVKMLNIHNWLQKMQDIEFSTINDWIQRIRNKLHNVAASGNGQFIRMSAMADDLSPWGNALLEDFEFSTNFLLKGKRTMYCSDIVVYQEAVDNVFAFIKQRSRWAQGGLDCIHSYLIKIVHSSEIKLKAKCEMIYFMFLPFFTMIVGIANMLTLVFACEDFNLFKNLFLFLIDFNIILSIYMSLKYNKKLKLINIINCLGMNIYNLILFPAIFIAFYRKITNNKTWIKTNHGV